MTQRRTAPAVLAGAVVVLITLIVACTAEPAATRDEPPTSSLPEGMVSDGIVVMDKACTQVQYRRACTTLEHAYNVYDVPGQESVVPPRITRTADGRFRLTAQSKRRDIALHDMRQSWIDNYRIEGEWVVVDDGGPDHLQFRYEPSQPKIPMIAVRIELHEVSGERAVLSNLIAETEPNPASHGS